MKSERSIFDSEPSTYESEPSTSHSARSEFDSEASTSNSEGATYQSERCESNSDGATFDSAPPEPDRGHGTRSGQPALSITACGPLKPGRALNHLPPAHPCRPHRQTMCTGAQSLFMGAKIMMTRAQTLSTSAHSLLPPAQIMSTSQQLCRRPRHTGLIALSIIHRPATKVFSYQQLCCRRPHHLLRSAQNDLGPQNTDPAHGQTLVTAAQCMWTSRLQRSGAASARCRSERPHLTAAWSIRTGR